MYCSLVRWGKLYFTLPWLAGWLRSVGDSFSLYLVSEARRGKAGKGRCAHYSEAKGKGKDDDVTRYDLRPTGRDSGEVGRGDDMTT